jgi:hypothetical protein
MSRSKKTAKRAKQAQPPAKTESPSSQELSDTQLEQVAGGKKAAATNQEFLTYKLNDILISGVS